MIELDKIREKAQVEGVGVNLILKEYIHFYILEYLFKSGYFSHLVFQGGTALRFAYGGVRYSEDLDFVLKRRNKRFLDSLINGLKYLTTHLDKVLPFARNIRFVLQKDTPNFKRFNLIMEVETFIAKDKTNIEIFNAPSYDNQTMIIRREDIPVYPAINVETPTEILSDKLVALGSRDYLKGRDIWDILFLLDTLKVSLDKNILGMVQKKIVDYTLNCEKFKIKLKDNIDLLKSKGDYVLKQEMHKFLPAYYRNSYDKEYKNIAERVLTAAMWLEEAIS